MLTTKLNSRASAGAKEIYDFATLSGIDRLQWRSSQPRGAETETVVAAAVLGGRGGEKREKSGKGTAEMKALPQKQNQFGRDNKPRCPAERENVIRANGPPNTPQVHGSRLHDSWKHYVK